jgi:STE24 endopeptidase
MNETRAARYQRLTRRTQAAGLVAGGALLALLVFTPGSRWLAGWASSVGRGASPPVAAFVALAAFITCAVALWELFALPGALYGALAVGRRYGRSEGEPTIEGVVAAQAQAAVVALAGALAAGVVVELAVWIAGPVWWLLAGVGVAGLLAAALRVAPWMLGRLGEAGPVSRPGLSALLEELAARARVPVAGIEEWHAGRSSASTAIVAGVGRERRIFISRDLIRDWSDDEIAVVVAHELAHHARNDLWRTLAVDAAVLSAAFCCAELALANLGSALGLAGPGDLAALPFVALVVGAAWLAATPLRHAQSRQQERAADDFALRLTGRSEAFQTALKRLSASHLAEERPATAVRWLFHRHPTVAERLAAAERYSERGF